MGFHEDLLIYQMPDANLMPREETNVWDEFHNFYLCEGVTKSCRLTNSTLVYEPKWGGGGSRGLSQWVQWSTWSPNKLWRSNSIFLTYACLVLLSRQTVTATQREERPEYVILDDFLVFYPRYTRALPGVFQKSRIFHILNKSAITWGNCILPRVLARTWGRNISWLELV